MPNFPLIADDEPLPSWFAMHAEAVLLRLTRGAPSGRGARMYDCQFRKWSPNLNRFTFEARIDNKYHNIQEHVPTTKDCEKLARQMLQFFRHVEQELTLRAVRSLT